MQSSDVLAVFVTYHPEARFQQSVESLVGQVSHILIVDNNSSETEKMMLRSISDSEHITLLENEENVGLGTPYNEAFRIAKEKGLSWVLTLDQDSMVFPKIVETLSLVYHNYPRPERIGVIGTNFIDPATNRLRVGDNTSNNKKTKLEPGEWSSQSHVINSGSIFSVSAYECVGGFREDFFIDRIDLEYCLRLERSGFKILISNYVSMTHTLGKQREHRLIWKPVLVTHHSALRRYYITRNHLIYMYHLIQWNPSRALRELMYFGVELLKMIIFEDRRYRKMEASIFGAWHAVTGRRGRIPLRLEKRIQG